MIRLVLVLGITSALVGCAGSYHPSQEFQKAENAPITEQINFQPAPPVMGLTAVEKARRDGRPCKTFEEAITVRGKLQSVTGWACRTHDGYWEIM